MDRYYCRTYRRSTKATYDVILILHQSSAIGFVYVMACRLGWGANVIICQQSCEHRNYKMVTNYS